MSRRGGGKGDGQPDGNREETIFTVMLREHASTPKGIEIPVNSVGEGVQMFATANGPPAGGHAVVIGGSLAGLLAARVLADHFGRVTVVERDAYPGGPEPRKGVPQGRHAHIMLMRGRREFERLFPGLDAIPLPVAASRSLP
jgi:hypothetical protein